MTHSGRVSSTSGAELLNLPAALSKMQPLMRLDAAASEEAVAYNAVNPPRELPATTQGLEDLQFGKITSLMKSNAWSLQISAL